MTHQIKIHYCKQCRWMLRAVWMAQELLSTFSDEICEVSLKPGTGGIFEVWTDGRLMWSRHEKGRFPDISELKQLVRDAIAPEMNLGHIDVK